jgi:hypothetical protein
MPMRRYCVLHIPPNGEQTKAVRSQLCDASIRQLTFQPVLVRTQIPHFKSPAGPQNLEYLDEHPALSAK